MSDFQSIAATILTAASAAWTDGPVVWPNEAFDPDNPVGRFKEFDPGCDYALLDVQFYQAQRESHGTAGLRVRIGELLVFVYVGGGRGPGEALNIADTFAAYFRDRNLLGGELQFHEPICELVGESDDQSYIGMTRCPFTAWSTAP